MINEKTRGDFESWARNNLTEVTDQSFKRMPVLGHLYENGHMEALLQCYQAATAATQRDAMAVAEAVRDAAVIMMDEIADSRRNDGMDFEPFMIASATLLADINLAAIVEAARPAAASGAAADLERVYDEFGIGAQARTIGILLGNVGNAMRRAECLSAIEREFFMVTGEVDEDYPDQEPDDECLLNWGHGPADYVEAFREALQEIAAAEAALPVGTEPTDEPVAWAGFRVMDANADKQGNWPSNYIRHRVFSDGPTKPKYGQEWVPLFAQQPTSAQQQGEPVAWIRFCSDGGYEGPIMDFNMEEVRKKSGAWTPLYAAPPAPACSVPEGYALVPVEPTTEMVDAAARASMQHLIDCIADPEKAKDVGSEEMTKLTHASRYRAMLAAAPKPEGGE